MFELDQDSFCGKCKNRFVCYRELYDVLGSEEDWPLARAIMEDADRVYDCDHYEESESDIEIEIIEDDD